MAPVPEANGIPVSSHQSSPRGLTSQEARARKRASTVLERGRRR
jgi:hypothetical protein